MEENKKIKECLELQLCEVEMLMSMYPNKDEFTITIPSIIADINTFIEDKTKKLPNHLDYTLRLKVPESEDQLEINVNLPHKYPDVEPKVYVRSAELNREEQKELNCAISNFLASQHRGELYISQLMTWLSENSSLYFLKKQQVINEAANARKLPPLNENKFSRLWIYSHHIYNIDKRKTIVKTGEDAGLSGFCLPGKPGIICVEGLSRDCDDFYQRIKQLSWKKISIVKEETYDDFDSNMQKFDSFKEISFEVRRGPAREYHMDMSGFYKFLEDHGCGYAFQDIFGLEGHSTEHK